MAKRPQRTLLVVWCCLNQQRLSSSGNESTSPASGPVGAIPLPSRRWGFSERSGSLRYFLALNCRNRSKDNRKPNGMAGAPRLRPETVSCSFPKWWHAQISKVEAIKRIPFQNVNLAKHFRLRHTARAVLFRAGGHLGGRAMGHGFAFDLGFRAQTGGSL